MRMVALATMAAVLAAGSGLRADGPTTRPDRTGPLRLELPHTGEVFGQGGEWDRRFAAESLAILSSLAPDPAWEAKLRALPDNTWLECKPTGPQQPPTWRSEVPMVYVPAIGGCMFVAGCTAPGYSSDTWVYKTGANRWVQMWPNFIKGGAADRLNKGPRPDDRPFTRCSLGLASDTDRNVVVLHGGANSADRRTWTWDPAGNAWTVEAAAGAGPPRGEDNCVGFVPGFGVVELHGTRGTKEAETWLYRPRLEKWEKLATRGAPPGGHNSPLIWAAGPKRLIYWAHTADQLWAFDPANLTWQDITPAAWPKPTRFYRQGIAYDSTNNVILMYGSKDAPPAEHGPWAYSFDEGTWQQMTPAKGPPRGAGQQMLSCYDAHYNVLVIAGSGRGTWVYRYRQAPPPAAAGGR